MNDRVDGFLAAFRRWALTQSDIRAVALVGSYARNTATANSDVDLVILTKQPEQYLRDKQWTGLFGEVERHQVENYGKVTSLRVWYKDQLEIEYGLTDETWANLPLDEGTQDVISAGMTVLVERGNLLSQHRSE